MAYVIENLSIDKTNQDAYQETFKKTLGPYDCAGGAENCIVVVKKGSIGNFSIIARDTAAQGTTIKVYGYNGDPDDLHATAPEANNAPLLLATLTVPNSGSDGGFITGSWDYLIFTENSGGAETDNIYIDCKGNQRVG